MCLVSAFLCNTVCISSGTCLCPTAWQCLKDTELEPKIMQFCVLSRLHTIPQVVQCAGGNLRLWRQLGGVVQAHGSTLTAEQLCEVLSLVQAADLPVPMEWLGSCMQRIQVGDPFRSSSSSITRCMQRLKTTCNILQTEYLHACAGTRTSVHVGRFVMDHTQETTAGLTFGATTMLPAPSPTLCRNAGTAATPRPPTVISSLGVLSRAGVQPP
jgi:hypothetical protein